jgi:hypothetical protein
MIFFLKAYKIKSGYIFFYEHSESFFRVTGVSRGETIKRVTKSFLTYEESKNFPYKYNNKLSVLLQ